jgi:hypothetical protein
MGPRSAGVRQIQAGCIAMAFSVDQPDVEVRHDRGTLADMFIASAVAATCKSR